MGAKVSSSGPSKRGAHSTTSDPNVIPFVDVMLVLLIIFMVAAPIATVDVNVDLPSSKVIPSKRPPKQTYISIQERNGAAVYYVGNERVADPSMLGKEVYKEVPKNNKETARKTGEERDIAIIMERIYIRGDGSTPYRNVVYAMNRIQDEGFFKVALVGLDKR
jgi:biopolymer transport protein ExbD